MNEFDEINKIINELVEDFRYVLNKYIDDLEKDENFHNNYEWKQAMDINKKWFDI